jgi:CDGSH-type Zn-finger protein
VTMSEPVTIKASSNGPYLLKGPVVVVDPAGNELHIRAGKSLALCRCGASSTKPLCDGSHSRMHFEASGDAPEAVLQRYARR